MSDAVVQKGTTMKVGFGSLAYSGYLAEDGVEYLGTQYQEEDLIRDENNAVQTILLSSPVVPFRATFLIEDAGSITPPAHGSAVTLTNPAGVSTAFFCNAGSAVRLSRKVSVLTLDLSNYPDITHS